MQKQGRKEELNEVQNISNILLHFYTVFLHVTT